MAGSNVAFCPGGERRVTHSRRLKLRSLPRALCRLRSKFALNNSTVLIPPNYRHPSTYQCPSRPTQSSFLTFAKKRQPQSNQHLPRGRAHPHITHTSKMDRLSRMLQAANGMGGGGGGASAQVSHTNCTSHHGKERACRAHTFRWTGLDWNGKELGNGVGCWGRATGIRFGCSCLWVLEQAWRWAQ